MDETTKWENISNGINYIHFHNTKIVWGLYKTNLRAEQKSYKVIER